MKSKKKFIMNENGKRDFVMTCVIIGIVIIIGVGFIISNMRALNEVKDSNAMLQFIQYLQNQSIKIYGVDGCPWCQKQRQEFGEYFSLLLQKGIYINCTKDYFLCENITSFPTWIINNTYVYAGYIPLNITK